MELVWLEVYCRESVIAELGFHRIASCVEFSPNYQALASRSVSDRLDNHLVTDQRAAGLVLSDAAKHLVLNLIPLTRSRRKMIGLDWHV
jgi:hypothetical protein